MQGDSVKYTRKNDDVRPFEAVGDTNLEHFAQKTDSSLFALGNHSKKRPHNIVLGRFFDHRLHDVLELGVERYKGIKDFAKAATAVQIGNKVLLTSMRDESFMVPTATCLYCSCAVLIDHTPLRLHDSSPILMMGAPHHEALAHVHIMSPDSANFLVLRCLSSLQNSLKLACCFGFSIDALYPSSASCPSHSIILYYTVSCHVMSYCTILCHVMSCHVMSCHVMSCHTVPHNIT